ncbi:patatin-like phospholipase family protein [Cellulophaga baltica]|uniref:patatin-like phospholipase family protein n=1 Tax=Cellulophaga TaxID=104264 RepID=UPI001C06B3AD|nr:MULTISPECIES: patatin-like phospholipase family protein [Cellulophaga]MBU2995692.1 patatin-like phospholipase family protein [Cellulophaga baltica]MDO6767086.1 patatin-like phospholipase family protein [Cellulophaga sp. 1_MG-2023]
MCKKLYFLIVLFPFFLVQAQELKKNEDLKVGLVLSGGGAKGFAHIGALKVIEEAGIKIDYIGGTSMGAIVGALYAAGYSAHQLDSIFKVTDFNKLIQDELPRNAKTFYEKEDSERYALTLPFNKFKVSFPSAISRGQSVYNILVKFLYHVKDINDFNELPIPFFCVATNVETGDPVVLDKGYLPEAIMASGTFPSLFEPTEIDGNVLIDGGVVNNYPVDGVKKMGADVIIGVDVQHGLSNRETLSSATEILLQINNYRTVADMVEKSKKTDIYIKPDMEKYSVIDFGLTDEIIDKGEVAARKKIAALLELAKKQNADIRPKKNIKEVENLIINDLIIEGSDNYSRGYVKGKLRVSPDDEITFEKLSQGISNLSATGNFKTIRYYLNSEEDKTNLDIKLRENSTKTFLKAGLHYDNFLKSAAILNLTKKNVFFDDDVGSFDLILGDNIRYNLEYYIDKGTYWSIGFNSSYVDFSYDVPYSVLESNYDIPEAPTINEIDIDITDVTNQFYLQTVLKEEFAFTIGAEHKFLKYSTDTLSDNEDETIETNTEDGKTYFEKSNFFNGFAQVLLDTYDDKYFPTKGLYIEGDIHYYIASSDFNNNFKDFSITQGKVGVAFPIMKNLSLNIETEGGFKLGTSPVTSFDFMLGGFGARQINNFIPFLGYDFINIPGNSYIKSYASFDYEVSNKAHLLMSLNFANVDDDLYRTGEWFTLPTYSGYGVGCGWESFIGPVQVIYTWSPERDSNNIFFSVGYWF